jgi:spore maturation protein B
LNTLVRLSGAVIPLLLFCAAALTHAQGTDIMQALFRGAEKGISVIVRLVPILCGLLCAVYMLRASGALDWLGAMLAPVLSFLGIPPEVTPLILLRPFSGSGALAAGTEIMQSSGPDSLAGRMVAVMLASSETTLYTAGVYFGAANVTKTRYTLWAAFAAEVTAFILSAILVQVFWSF